MLSGSGPLQVVEEIYRKESRRVFATLVRLLKDFDLAEEAMHEAFAAAMTQWGPERVPANPRAWLVSTGRFKAIDLVRRRQRFAASQLEIAARFEEVAQANEARADAEIEDDPLRLIFTCCHPVFAPEVQVPLTLREVCGLTTDEIARAFLIESATMAQRIVRGKAKIRDAGIPYVIPGIADLPERLDAVLSVIYLVFNEGYSASSGDTVTRADLSGEAIRLCRLLLELLPDPEAMGLLALMLLQESRGRPAHARRRHHSAGRSGPVTLERGIYCRGAAIDASGLCLRAIRRLYDPGGDRDGACRRLARGGDGLARDRRPVRPAIADVAFAGDRTESSRRGRDAGWTGGWAAADRSNPGPGRPGELPPCACGASRPMSAARPPRRGEGGLRASPRAGQAGAGTPVSGTTARGIRPSPRGSPKSLSENRLGEGDSPILLRGLRKIGTVPGGSRIGSERCLI